MRARVAMWTKENGGRHTPVFDGYRPDFRAGTDGYGDLDLGVAEVKPPETDPMLVPGTEVEVELAPVDSAAWANVTTGPMLGQLEGGRRVGTGRIL